MTETRKQIIELIESYMDKTEGYNFLFIDDKGNIREMNQYMFICGNEVYIERPGYDEPRLFCNIKEVIGHYDITAVLKYMFYNETRTLNNGDKIKFFGDNLSDRYENSIPNKPLHLYTEEEDKDLLELLQKIGTNNK